MFSPLSNMKTSDKTSKSSLRYVFEADVECYEKTISNSFPIFKRKRLTLMLMLMLMFGHIAKRDGPVLVLNLFCHQKNIHKAYVKKYSVLVYLTKGYEGIRNKIDHLCLLHNFFTVRSMFWNYVSNGEEQVSHHLYRDHYMSSLSLVYL